MSEIVKDWILDNIRKQIADIEADIKNEQVWADGSEDDFEAEMHEDNIALLEEELEYYNEQLEEVSKM